MAIRTLKKNNCPKVDSSSSQDLFSFNLHCFSERMPFHILSLALLCGGLVTGAPTQPLSALPDNTSEEMIGWVSPDARRNTWGIIWSCLTIFIVCSWKCVHLNVPSHNESIAGWHTISKLPWSIEIPYWPQRLLWIKWRRKVLWMAFIAIAPEYGVALALAQYLAAKKDLTEANERLQNENRYGTSIIT